MSGAWSNPTSPNLPDFWLFVENFMGIPDINLPRPIGSPAVPVLTAGSAGSLPTETVYVKITYVSQYGETTPSTEASVAVTGPTGSVSVASPATQPDATGWNVYAADATGAEVLQNSSPLTIGSPYVITTLATSAASPPTTDTSGSPWVTYAFNQALALTVDVSTITPIMYVLAVYNGAGHILLTIAPDQAGLTYFQTARTDMKLLQPQIGIITSSADEGTSNSFAVGDGMRNMTMTDLDFYRSPYGRSWLQYTQDFGAIFGLT